MNQNHLIYHLRETQMDPKLQAQLSSIISAYRPHDPIPTLDELKGDRVDYSHVSLKAIKQQVKEDFCGPHTTTAS
jgi:hypothetical protein